MRTALPEAGKALRLTAQTGKDLRRDPRGALRAAFREESLSAPPRVSRQLI